MGKVTRSSAKKNEEVISENSETESEFFESEEESDMEITGSEEDSDVVSNLFNFIYIYII